MQRAGFPSVHGLPLQILVFLCSPINYRPFYEVLESQSFEQEVFLRARVSALYCLTPQLTQQIAMIRKQVEIEMIKAC